MLIPLSIKYSDWLYYSFKLLCQILQPHVCFAFDTDLLTQEECINKFWEEKNTPKIWAIIINYVCQLCIDYLTHVISSACNKFLLGILTDTPTMFFFLFSFFKSVLEDNVNSQMKYILMTLRITKRNLKKICQPLAKTTLTWLRWVFYKAFTPL